MSSGEVGIRAVAYFIVCSILLFLVFAFITWVLILVQLINWIFILPINEVLIG